ncbi:MAG: HNH endonuclease [Alkalilacustris sp.]
MDHATPHKGGRKLFWDRSNWAPMCASCHGRKTARHDGGFGRPVTGGGLDFSASAPGPAGEGTPFSSRAGRAASTLRSRRDSDTSRRFATSLRSSSWSSSPTWARRAISFLMR